ncbi:metallophosphoesterase [Gallibacterium anatis]|uniref:metallophosphoesterase n=1 Tax=Gallibacterium anatis TaxID=750 RepID=UPI000BA07BB8|nr:metallophosphoesterase [Gallibacterium anatis]OZN49931.1 metallophosphoesterase [Gallibacterium anatis]
MLFRYIALIALQLFIFIAIRSIDWFFFVKPTKPHYKRVFFWLSYIVINAFILLSIARIIPDGFKYSAYILTTLWYITLVAVMIFLLRKVLLLFAVELAAFPMISRCLALVSLSALFAYSIHQAYTPQIVHYSVKIDKTMQPLRIGVASDLHLGKLFGIKQLEQLQHIFEQQKVDIILLPGDLMDDNLNAYFAEKMGPHFAKLSAPLGVYATLGNHDFFQQPQQIAHEVRKEGVYLLTDQAVIVSDKFILAGRNDEMDQLRQTTEQILASIPAEKRQNLPILLMDHRPFSLAENANAGADIQVSGHTHNGQIFPGNVIEKWVYELSYGYKQIKQMHTFVTSGYGFWGVPFRLGSQSEVMIIDVSGTK